MVTLPRKRVQEVHLKCRVCSYQHFNTRNQGTIYIPGQIFGEDEPLRLPQTCHNRPHFARPGCGRIVPSYVLAQLGQEARRTAFEIGALNPDKVF